MPETNARQVEDLRSLLQEVETALSQAGAQAGEHVAELRDRLRAVLEDAQPHLEEWRARAREELYRYDDYVRAHPYQVVGVAAIVGAVVGLVLSRR